jgi:HPt (histidine-containing phosphotransfer) domain-containing protein
MPALLDRDLLDQYDADGLVVELIDLFLEDVPRMIARLRSALDAGAATTAARSAHTLAGCASNLGARALAELASRIECAARAGDLSGAARAGAELDEIEKATEAALREERERRHCTATQDAPLYVTVMR